MANPDDLCEGFSDLISTQERIVCPPLDHGVSGKLAKPISEIFQISHEMRVAQDNPMAGLVPGAKPTISKYAFSGQYVHMDMEAVARNPADPPKPSMINFFEYGSDNDMTIQSIFNFSNNRSCRVTTGKDADNNASLVKEMNVTVQNSSVSRTDLVLAAPKFLTAEGPCFEGVFVGSHLRKINDNVQLGGDLTFRKMKTPRGLMQDLVPSVGGAYAWLDGAGKKYAETSAKISFQANSIVPGSYQFQHWAKSKIHDRHQALCQLRIEPDQMAMFTGNNSLSINGKVAYMSKIPDVDAKKALPGMPEKESGTVTRATLDTDWNLTSSFDTTIDVLPLRFGGRATYSIPKDELKLGLSFTYGE